MLEETIHSHDSKPYDPMEEISTSRDPNPPGDGGSSRRVTQENKQVLLTLNQKNHKIGIGQDHRGED